MTEFEELQLQLEKTEKDINLLESLTELCNNSAFKSLILDHFCKEYSIDMLKRSTDYTLDELSRSQCVVSAQASGILLRYFDLIRAKGVLAQSEIKDIKDSIDNERGLNE